MSIIPIILLAYVALDVEKADDYNLGLTKTNTLYCRGLLSLVVVFHHLALLLWRSGELVFSDLLFEHLGKVGYLAVGVFFFFSGYGLMTNLSQRGKQYLDSFISKRGGIVVLPYVIVALMTWAVEATLNHKIIGIYYFLEHLVVDRVIVENGWYVVELLLIYIGFWLIASHFPDVRWVRILLLCYNVALAMITIMLGYEICWYTSLLSFNVGTLVADIDTQKKWIHNRSSIRQALLFVAFMIFFFFERKASAPIGHFIFGNISAGFLCLFLFDFLGKHTFRKESGMYKVGAFSYEIYLIHGLIMLAMRSNTLYIHSKWVFCLMTVSLTLLLAYFFHICLNRLPRKNRKSRDSYK